ncbi:2-C-methyl-D-erythritol 4-phosphate cytidylyltransferase [Lentimicrobium saccharophilum]|uniref:2-C-methyl-D-erythritol 4-phosphate cytidylyltransferase n=1 Tax=Lentimicrobium saccharophilum TaxID=1678841 RepID=A0A0S7BST9_9BACT|nr:2-C-methyl-D-erythritol 4-phosphate cytidylyltransferase [Lentimicrobium saccharophilum]GAP43898.1 2-C-methyl-D-erythritol 4-phosphate cytidylyltransferase [Lentimicrobium saccharophilum]
MERFVIIVAGGTGQRMGAGIPKQFLPLCGRPLLMHTMEAFHRFDAKTRVVLVLPAGQAVLWNELCTLHGFTLPHKLAEGGETRGISVRNGLDTISATGGVVAVHDGARPLVSQETIATGFALAESGKNAVPALPLTDSLRIIDGNGTRALDRTLVRRVQTPQCFPLYVLRMAYDHPDFMHFTDDAQLVEKAGFAITLYEGNAENIKITAPFDLKLAGLLAGGMTPGLLSQQNRQYDE